VKQSDIVWGRSKKSKKVHLFVKGNRQCITGGGTPKKPADIFPDWDPHDPDTCPKCRERYKWLMKGAIPASPHQP
jgi:hypothetical protein